MKELKLIIGRRRSCRGHIVFEDDGFRFTPHSFNIQADSVFVPYQHIQEVSKVNTLFIVPNGVKIIDKNKMFIK